MWNHKWFKTQRPIVKLFWVYLVSNPCTETSGLYPFNESVVPALLGCSNRLSTECIHTVSEARQAIFEDGWVLIPTFIDHQQTPNPDMWKHITNQVRRAPKCLLRKWLSHYADRMPTGCRQSLSMEVEVEVDVEVEVEEEEKERTSAPSNSQGESSTPAVPPELSGLSLYDYTQIPDDNEHKARRTSAIKLCAVYAARLPGWREECPGVDIAAETKKAHGWEVDHPRKRKTDRVRFLGDWFRRQQDKPRAQDGESDKDAIERRIEEARRGGNK